MTCYDRSRLYGIDGEAITSAYSSFSPLAHWDARYNVSETYNGVCSHIDMINGYEVLQGARLNQPDWTNKASDFCDGYAIDYAQGTPSQYLAATDATIVNVFDGAASDFTLFGIASALASGDSQAMFSAADNGGTANYIYLGYSPDEALRLAFSDGGYSDVVSSTTDLTDDHYFVVTFAHATNAVAIRVNGSEVATGTLTRTPTGLTHYAFGARITSNFDVPFGGKMREFGIFSSAVSGATLTSLESTLAERMG